MLADLGHPSERGEPVYDVTFENVQAGLRTDYLFRLANQKSGLVVGTGDLSELGLGWCTYGVGDHMSHYNVNASVPKTLIQHLIRFVAASGDVSPETVEVLNAVLATEISPELVPAEPGAVIQSAAADRRALCVAGLQPVLPHPPWLPALAHRLPGRAGLGRCRARELAGEHPRERPAGLFPRGDPPLAAGLPPRFFANQFKRSTLPNGPKITSGSSLSPRGRLARALGCERPRSGWRNSTTALPPEDWTRLNARAASPAGRGAGAGSPAASPALAAGRTSRRGRPRDS